MRRYWGVDVAAVRRTLYREVLWHDRSRIHFEVALRCTPAIAGAVLIGSVLHQQAAAAIMCGGALTVGSGVFQRIGHSQIGPMVAATFGMGISAGIGTLAGLAPAPLFLAVMIWGFAAGLLPVLDGGGQWIGQQCAIAMLVASSFPGSWDHALIRAGLVTAGGALQIVTMETLLRFSDLNTELKNWSETMRDARSAWRTVRDALVSGSIYLHFAWRVALTLAAAVMTERLLGLPNGYWVGMTALVLLRLEFHDTWHRSASRVCGTLAGAAAVLLAAAGGAPEWVFAVGIPITAFFCFAYQQFSYAAFSCFVTAYVVLLLAYGGVPQQLVAHYRVVGTLLGAGFALIGHLHFMAWRRARALSG